MVVVFVVVGFTLRMEGGVAIKWGGGARRRTERGVCSEGREECADTGSNIGLCIHPVYSWKGERGRRKGGGGERKRGEGGRRGSGGGEVQGEGREKEEERGEEREEEEEEEEERGEETPCTLEIGVLITEVSMALVPD